MTTNSTPQDTPQMGFEEVILENDDLENLLEAREATKETVAKRRKIDKDFKEIVETLGEYAGKTVRVGRFIFQIVDDPGGEEVPGYTRKGGIKAKKIKAVSEQ